MTERRFSAGDQDRFAQLSGDFNPLHVDPVAARRLLFGGPVVHGVHLVLWALNEHLRTRRECGAPAQLQHLRVAFREPILVDQAATAQTVLREGDVVRIAILGEGRTAVSIRASLGAGVPAEVAVPPIRAARSRPRVLARERIPSAHGTLDLCLDPELAGSLFGDLMATLPAPQLSQLLATTRLVGMECPGLHSVYAALELEFCHHCKGPAQLTYSVSDFDDRFGRVSMLVASPGMRGTVQAFLRPEPRTQPGIAELRASVGTGEFRGQRALVVGGSRGLGEVAAKLLAAGGADVRLTYHQGAEDAERVVRDIVAGGGSAESFAFDVLDPPESATVPLDHCAHTHLYYFATPFILDGTPGRFTLRLFHRFAEYYVAGFTNTFQVVRESSPDLAAVFYASSTLVEELPLGMGEYAVAKAAGETLCAFFQKAHPELRILWSRLPRLATDQTNRLLTVDAGDPAPVVLRELRRLRDAAGSGPKAAGGSDG